MYLVPTELRGVQRPGGMNGVREAKMAELKANSGSCCWLSAADCSACSMLHAAASADSHTFQEVQLDCFLWNNAAKVSASERKCHVCFS